MQHSRFDLLVTKYSGVPTKDLAPCNIKCSMECLVRGTDNARIEDCLYHFAEINFLQQIVADRG